MTISKEAIEAASIVTAIEQTITLIERGSINAKLISALLAECKSALSTLPIAVEGKVKALEWHESLTDDGREQWHSNDRESITVMGRAFADNERYWLFNAKKGFPSLQEAKAAAQADYETRILSALISSPGKDGGQEVEAVCCPGDKCEHFWEEAPCCNGWRPQPASTALVETDHTAGRKLSLWFFRDLSGEQRGKLFGLFGMNDAQKDTNHGYQAMALSQVVRALSASRSTSPWRRP